MKVHYATTFLQRLVGMLLGKGSKPGECLVISPCNDIHTLGMRWPIDVAFADCRGKVILIRRNVHPLRRIRCKNAALVIERRAQEGNWIDLGDCVPWAMERKRECP